jgi:hypothetical protein
MSPQPWQSIETACASPLRRAVMEIDHAAGRHAKAPHPECEDCATTCIAEWEGSRNSVCRTHKCDLHDGHAGSHKCSCGLSRRRGASGWGV